MVWGVCQLHDSSSFRLAQTKKTPLIFKKGSDRASYTFKVSNGTLSVPSSVQKLESIKWYYSTVKDDKADSGKLTDESFCKIYVILREPIKIGGEQPPRKDVLNIACEVAKGKKDGDSIRDAMTGGLWNYLNGNGFTYKPGLPSHSIVPDDPPIESYKDAYQRFMIFKLRELVDHHYGDCKDASSLSHICCYSLGVDQKVIVTTYRNSRRTFFTKRVKGFGLPSFISNEFAHHQVSIDTSSNKIYDPTCKFLPNDFAVNKSRKNYLDLFVEFAESDELYYRGMRWYHPREVMQIQ